MKTGERLADRKQIPPPVGLTDGGGDQAPRMQDLEWVEVGWEFLGIRQVMPQRLGALGRKWHSEKQDKTVDKTHKRFPVDVRQSSSCWS